VPIYGAITDALDDVDVLVEYTFDAAVGENVRASVERGAAVVIGSSELSGQLLLDRRDGSGCRPAFVTRHLPQWEIIDDASASKADAPSGTARELAERLAAVLDPHVEVPVALPCGYRRVRVRQGLGKG
jgi:4-hydroxy-tetrahydrodipicolinate reductase